MIRPSSNRLRIGFSTRVSERSKMIINIILLKLLIEKPYSIHKPTPKTHSKRYSSPPHTALPPSTSILTPVTNPDSSPAKNTPAHATSDASQSRPRGTLDRNLVRFSGVSGTPVKDSNLRRYYYYYHRLRSVRFVD